LPPTKTDPATRAERLKTLLTEARDIATKAEEEGREFTEDERTDVKAKLDEAKGLKADVSLVDALGEFGDDVKATGSGGVIDAAKGGPTLDRYHSLGKAFVEADEYVEWMKRMAPNGSIPESSRGFTSPAFSVPGLAGFGYAPTGRKAPVTGAGADSAGALISPDHKGLLDEDNYQRPLTILDVMTRGTTDSDSVEFARVNAPTNAAAPVAEATTTGGADGTKPESTFPLEKVTAPVRTVAHWIPATKRALSDAGQVRTLIDNFLVYGLAEELEDQIISGDGTGENFTGILNTTGVQVQLFATDFITTVRKAKTLIKVNGKASANAVAMHPDDAETLELTKDLDGRFYFGGPDNDGIPSLWRMRVIETETIASGGPVLVGDFTKAVIWDREQAGIMASDSHADFFIRNLVAILGELRAAFGVLRPAAFATAALV
jgi:HK97 family phage major capsid protein